MSKKLSKRRSRGEITGAAVNAHLGTLADCVDKVPSTSDLGNISSCTSRILSLAASEGIYYTVICIYRCKGYLDFLFRV